MKARQQCRIEERQLRGTDVIFAPPLRLGEQDVWPSPAEHIPRPRPRTHPRIDALEEVCGVAREFHGFGTPITRSILLAEGVYPDAVPPRVMQAPQDGQLSERGTTAGVQDYLAAVVVSDGRTCPRGKGGTRLGHGDGTTRRQLEGLSGCRS